MTGTDLAAAAHDLIGSRFRLHGRDPATGIDCIGVLAAAMARTGRPADLPGGYPLRLRDPQSWLPDPERLGFRETDCPLQAGDVVLLRIGAAQFHLAIAASGGGWIHAHAGLRKVVHSPTLPDGEIAHRWRAVPGN